MIAPLELSRGLRAPLSSFGATSPFAAMGSGLSTRFAAVLGVPLHYSQFIVPLGFLWKAPLELRQGIRAPVERFLYVSSPVVVDWFCGCGVLCNFITGFSSLVFHGIPPL